MIDPFRYVGLPFGEGAGQVTCWSLVRAVYADTLGVVLPAYGEISARDLIRVARRMTDGAEEATWSVPPCPGVLDVVLMRSARGGAAVCHVGVMVDDRSVLHAEEATGAVLVPLSHFTIRNRVAGFRRYAA